MSKAEVLTNWIADTKHGVRNPFRFCLGAAVALTLLCMLVVAARWASDLTTCTESATVEAVIGLAYAADRPLTVTYVTALDSANYLTDKTTTASRRAKVTPACPVEGTVGCYVGKRVRLDGCLTNRSRPIMPMEIGPDGSRPGTRVLEAREFVVLDFDVLD